jgi:hypothetical protein
MGRGEERNGKRESAREERQEMGWGISEGEKVRLREVGTRREEDEHLRCTRMDLMDLEHFVGAEMRMHVTGRLSLGQTTRNRHGSSLSSAIKAFLKTHSGVVRKRVGGGSCKKSETGSQALPSIWLA